MVTKVKYLHGCMAGCAKIPIIQKLFEAEALLVPKVHHNLSRLAIIAQILFKGIIKAI